MAKAMEKKYLDEIPAELAAMKEKEAGQLKEPVYTVGELADSASVLFQTRPECVIAALRGSGKPCFPVSEAEKIVKAFLKKEVM